MGAAPGTTPAGAGQVSAEPLAAVPESPTTLDAKGVIHEPLVNHLRAECCHIVRVCKESQSQAALLLLLPPHSGFPCPSAAPAAALASAHLCP